MSDPANINCPECDDVDRRDFIRVVSGGAASLAAVGALSSVPRLVAQPPAAVRQPRPAEDLVRELHASLTAEQRPQVILPWEHGAGASAQATRLRMYNAPLQNARIGQIYTPAQQELIDRILHAISSGEEGYRKLTRNHTFDGSRNLQGCGSHIFGDPTGGNQFCWLFTGHHLTVRCDGNSERDTAFGGPMYYGHSPDGTSVRNIFNYQTRSVQAVYDALNETQRRTASLTGTPGEQYASVRFRASGQPFPGLAAADLSADHRRLVETVMRTVLDIYRREDADEVMDIVRRNGGMERIHLAFYRDRDGSDTNWHFWRLEGPGFVWNYRVMPHVHTFVNIAARA